MRQKIVSKKKKEQSKAQVKKMYEHRQLPRISGMRETVPTTLPMHLLCHLWSRNFPEKCLSRLFCFFSPIRSNPPLFHFPLTVFFLNPPDHVFQITVHVHFNGSCHCVSPHQQSSQSRSLCGSVGWLRRGQRLSSKMSMEMFLTRVQSSLRTHLWTTTLFHPLPRIGVQQMCHQMWQTRMWSALPRKALRKRCLSQMRYRL